MGLYRDLEWYLAFLGGEIVTASRESTLVVADNELGSLHPYTLNQGCHHNSRKLVDAIIPSKLFCWVPSATTLRANIRAFADLNRLPPTNSPRTEFLRQQRAITVPARVRWINNRRGSTMRWMGCYMVH